jgi:hypothetical protein
VKITTSYSHRRRTRNGISLLLSAKEALVAMFHRYVSKFCSSILSTISSEFSNSYSKFMECTHALEKLGSSAEPKPTS